MLNKFLNALPKVNDELKVFAQSNGAQKGTAIVTKIELDNEIVIDDQFVNIGKITFNFFTPKYHNQEKVYTIQFDSICNGISFVPHTNDCYKFHTIWFK